MSVAPLGADAGALHNADTSVAACGIAVMAKASAPGRAKTRLVPPLTFEQAAAFNTAFLQDVFDNILLAAQEAAPHAGIAAYAAYGPPGCEDFFEQNLHSLHRPDSGMEAEFWRLPVCGD